MNHKESELQLLEAIYACQDEAERSSQRSLADRAGLSLGMTNALLRRFAERGWVKLLHISGRSLRYILTPAGVEEILLRSMSYFSRAARSASLYRDRIEEFVRRVAAEGRTSLVLEGSAELDFLFDYSCMRHGLAFYKNPIQAKREALAADPGSIFVGSGRSSEAHVKLADILTGSRSLETPMS